MNLNQKVSYHQKSIVSSNEFKLIYDTTQNEFTPQYYSTIKKAIGKRVGYNIVCNKKFSGKKTITVFFNCAKSSNDAKCMSAGNISLKKTYMFDDPVVFDFSANCLHYNGKLT